MSDDRSDDPEDGPGDGWGDDEGSGDEHDDFVAIPLDDHEVVQIRRDLHDLESFEDVFRPEGYRGVSVWCQDCIEDHLYPWDMLRENLQVLIETGETPVHEPAFAPEPDRYIPWDYARGYVDALHEAGLNRRLDVDQCPRCRLPFTDVAKQANFCPRCATPLLTARLQQSLFAAGMDQDAVDAILGDLGLPS